jgi:hypothetical protein
MLILNVHKYEITYQYFNINMKNMFKYIKKQKEIHDGLLQRLRSAAGYRESSLLKTSVLAISDSLEGVSVDSLLSQVLKFDLLALYMRGMEDKKGGNDEDELSPVPCRFLHEDQYIESFHPLLIEEVKAALANHVVEDSYGERNRGGRFEVKNLSIHGLRVLTITQRKQRGTEGSSTTGKTDKKVSTLLEIKVVKAVYKEAQTTLLKSINHPSLFLTSHTNGVDLTSPPSSSTHTHKG